MNHILSSNFLSKGKSCQVTFYLLCLHIKRQRHIGFIVPLLALPFIIDSKSRADALCLRPAALSTDGILLDSKSRANALCLRPAALSTDGILLDSKSRADALYVRLTPNDFSLKPLETPKCLQAGAWGFCAGFYIFSVTLSLVSARASDASLCLYSFRLSFCLSLSSALIFASLALTLSISSGFSAESTIRTTRLFTI